MRAQDSDRTPPLISSWWADRGVVEARLAAGADIASRDLYGGTLLHEAAESPWPDAVDVLLAVGAVAGARTCMAGLHWMASTPPLPRRLCWRPVPTSGRAMEHNEPRCILRGCRTFLRPPWRPVPTSRGTTVAGPRCMRRPACAGKPAAVEVLLAAGADAATWDSDGRTPLHKAPAMNPAVLRTLLGTNGPARGRTAPLEAIVNAAAKRIVEALLAAGADPAARDNDGRTATDVLVFRGSPMSSNRFSVEASAALRGVATEET